MTIEALIDHSKRSFGAFLGLCATCLCIDAASAEPQVALPISRPPMQCTADSLSTALAQGGHKSAVMRDASCLVSNEVASNISGWAAIIDVRDGVDFSRNHIPGAINMRLSEINTKPLPRGGELLVYGYGRVAVDAEQICYELRKGGFSKARVLADGFNAWARFQAGTELRREAEIASADFIAELSSGAPLVVVLAPGYPEHEFGSTLIRAHDIDKSVVPRMIRDGLAGSIGRKASRVILVGGDRIGDAAIASVLADRTIAKPVFYLAASAAELRQTISAQRALWAKAQKGPITPKGCSAS